MRYIAERVNGIWQVSDTDGERLPVVQGPGSEGATHARAAAERLNATLAKARPGGFSPADLLSWRTAHGLSQEKLATYLGVKWLAVWRWEKGERAIPPLLERALRDLDRELAQA